MNFYNTSWQNVNKSRRGERRRKAAAARRSILTAAAKFVLI
jgi:hypothetical protein